MLTHLYLGFLGKWYKITLLEIVQNQEDIAFWTLSPLMGCTLFLYFSELFVSWWANLATLNLECNQTFPFNPHIILLVTCLGWLKESRVFLYNPLGDEEMCDSANQKIVLSKFALEENL